jgi:hypothetical protein
MIYLQLGYAVDRWTWIPLCCANTFFCFPSSFLFSAQRLPLRSAQNSMLANLNRMVSFAGLLIKGILGGTNLLFRFRKLPN